MKKIFLLSLLFCSIVTLGQTYHKLINESLYWDVPIAEPGYICTGYSEYGPYRYKFLGDTVINDKTYSKIYYSSFITLLEPPFPNCPPFVVDTNFSLLSNWFLREDTIEKKVWRYLTINTPEEILLYDFSAEKGDTIEYAGFPDAIIDTVYDIVTYDGVSRKRFEFGMQGSFPGGFYIEGIGGAGGLLEIPYYAFEWGVWLQCVKDHDNNIIWDGSSNCFDFLTNVSSHDINYSINIYPNPFATFIRIETTSGGRLQLKIYDHLGIELFTDEVFESKTIDLSFLYPGIYFLKASKDNTVIVTKRIIKISGH